MNAPDLLAHDLSPRTVSPRPDRLLRGVHESDVAQAARTSACVLFTGRPDAKEIALQIHSLSGWRWGPFIAVDCGSSEAVVERRLFELLSSQEPAPGSELTLRLTQDGTVFLYEIGDLSFRLQAWLAQALVGGTPANPERRPRKRVMASSSVSLFDRVEAGTFDDRLFYRLNAIHFTPAGTVADS